MMVKSILSLLRKGGSCICREEIVSIEKFVVQSHVMRILRYRKSKRAKRARENIAFVILVIVYVLFYLGICTGIVIVLKTAS